MILLCHCKYTTTACVWWPCDQCTVGNMPDQHRSVLAWAAIYQKTKIQFCHFVWSMILTLLQLIWLFKSVKHGKTSLKAECWHGSLILGQVFIGTNFNFLVPVSTLIFKKVLISPKFNKTTPQRIQIFSKKDYIT